MNIVIKNKVGVQERRRQDDTAAQLEKLAANQDYIAMMTDIELEDDDEAQAESGVK